VTQWDYLSLKETTRSKQKMNPFDNDFFQNEKDRNDFFIALPVIALSGLFILHFLVQPKAEPGIDGIRLATIENPAERNFWERGSREEVGELEIGRAPAKTVALPSLPITPLEVKPVKKPISAPRLDKSETKESRGSVAKESEKAKTAAVKPKTPVIPESESDDVEKEATTQSSEIVKEEPASTKRVVDSSSRDLNCSIAVGLYVERKNIDKMMRRLRNQGYTPITVPLRRTTKVAIKIPCNSSESQRILRDIRANFAHDAFIE